MDINQLFVIAPPVRPLTAPNQLQKDLEELSKLRRNLPNNYPLWTDSTDLITYIKKSFKRNTPYLITTAYDVLTRINYKRRTDTNLFYKVSRPIHYGYYRKEEEFVVQSTPSQDENALIPNYNQAVRNSQTNSHLDLQTTTWDDILLINRRLLQHDYRVLARNPDRKLVIFPYDWLNGVVL